MVMIKLSDLLVERIDFHQTATSLVKHYGLRSKVKFGKVKGQNEADYDWVRDIINLKRSYPSVKEFIISVLHEIDHAKMRKRWVLRNTNTNIQWLVKKPKIKVVIFTMITFTKNKLKAGHKKNIRKFGARNIKF